MQSIRQALISIGQQVVRGLCYSCILLVLIQLYFWLTFQTRRHAEMDQLYAPTSEVLMLSGLALLVASFLISFFEPQVGRAGRDYCHTRHFSQPDFTTQCCQSLDICRLTSRRSQQPIAPAVCPRAFGFAASQFGCGSALFVRR
jgi:hypothetical protein